MKYLRLHSESLVSAKTGTILPCVYVCVWVAQSCPTLCNPMNCSPPGFSIHGILQARILKWGAIPFSRVSSRPRAWTQVSWVAGRFLTIWATTEALILPCTLLLQSCLTLCNPMGYSLPGSTAHGIFQARILECVAMPFSRGSSQHRDWTCISCVYCTGRQVLYHYCHLGSWLSKHSRPWSEWVLLKEKADYIGAFCSMSWTGTQVLPRTPHVSLTIRDTTVGASQGSGASLVGAQSTWVGPNPLAIIPASTSGFYTKIFFPPLPLEMYTKIGVSLENQT